MKFQKSLFTICRNPLRAQVVHIWRSAIGTRRDQRALQHYSSIVNALCREYGTFMLAEGEIPDLVLFNFVASESSTDRVLDAIEVSFRLIESVEGERTFRVDDLMSAHDAVAELNHRFLEHGVGYEYVSGQIIRKDSEFLHTQTIVPTLALLQGEYYKGANDEFLNALEHNRHGHTKECLNDCLKAFESTMKAICTKRKWKFSETDTANALISICYKNQLIPEAIQSHIGAVRASLESGVPTIRNKFSGHGQGATVVKLPDFYASYMLHLTATTIHFLVEAEKALR